MSESQHVPGAQFENNWLSPPKSEIEQWNLRRREEVFQTSLNIVLNVVRVASENKPIGDIDADSLVETAVAIAVSLTERVDQAVPKF